MAHIRKWKGGWQARYRDPAGKERSKSFERRVDAQRFLTTVGADMLRGSYVDPRAGRTPVREYAAEWMERQPWRPSTRDAVNASMRHVLAGIGDRPLGAVRRSEIQAMLLGLPLAASTVGTVHQHVRALFGAAVEDQLLAVNPAVGVRLPKVDKAPVVPLTAEQVWKLADAAPEALRAAVVAGAGLGLRQGEAMGLTVDRVDWLRRQVRVDRQLVTPNTGAPAFGPPKTPSSFRTIPAPDVVLEALTEHVRTIGTGDDGLLFHAGDGSPLARNAFGRLWRATAKRAQLEGVTYHGLRHHFASALIAAGCSVRAVQEALGHASAKETLDTYSHLWPTDPDRIRSAVDATLAAPAVPSRSLRSV